jgi:hypothetical protein
MEKILNHFLQPKVTFLIWGDLNINLLTKSNDALRLLTLMNTFNLTQVVDFPTRITNNNESLLDTVFIDTSTYDNIQIKPLINGLSDHDAQIICLNKTKLISKRKVPKIKLRLINDSTISSFQTLLKEEAWNQVYDSLDTNETFNVFQDALLRHFEASFPIVYINRRSKQNNWITKSIKISCNKKRELFTQYRRNTENIQIKNHCKKYCIILKKVIKEAKKQFFHKQIATSANKVKTTWDIIKDNSGNPQHARVIDSLECGNEILKKKTPRHCKCLQ